MFMGRLCYGVQPANSRAFCVFPQRTVVELSQHNQQQQRTGDGQQEHRFQPG